jgi:FtsH-binding integral membrane protein
MVIGHFGFGLGAKKFAPKVSLGTLFLAVQWADLLWPTLLLLHIEHVGLRPGDPHFPLDFEDYPVTHSLLAGILWGLGFGLLRWFFFKDAKGEKDRRGALVLGICVVSHWVLDFIVHMPDLPLFPGNSPKVGLGLWNWPVLTALVEGVLFVIGLTLYLRSTRAKNTIGKWSLWLLAILLVVAHVAGLFSPMPSSAEAIGWAAQFQWIFVGLGYWVDSNRESVG